MKKTFAIIGTISILLLASLFLSLSSQSQTVNMGRTYVSSQNVRYANNGATGTTLNNLAKLTGAPSTAILTATTDTSGIIGIVVAGAGTTGSADIAFKGKALCVFDSATTAGHYVANDTSTAGDCMDAGATYPTSGQVIGVVTSTNGGAGTYEVDLSLGQAQAGGAGGGATIDTGTYAALPGICTDGDAYLPSDSLYQILRCGAANVWSAFFNGQIMVPPVLGDYSWVNQGTATTDTTSGGLAMIVPTDATGRNLRLLVKAPPAGDYTATMLMHYVSGYSESIGGIVLYQSSNGKLLTFNIKSTTGTFVTQFSQWNSVTSFYYTYNTTGNHVTSGGRWLRITKATGNYTCYVSSDGSHWVAVSGGGVADWITADGLGFFVDSYGAPVTMTVMSWNVI